MHRPVGSVPTPFGSSCAQSSSIVVMSVDPSPLTATELAASLLISCSLTVWNASSNPVTADNVRSALAGVGPASDRGHTRPIGENWRVYLLWAKASMIGCPRRLSNERSTVISSWSLVQYDDIQNSAYHLLAMAQKASQCMNQLQ